MDPVFLTHSLISPKQYFSENAKVCSVCSYKADRQTNTLYVSKNWTHLYFTNNDLMNQIILYLTFCSDSNKAKRREN